MCRQRSQLSKLNQGNVLAKKEKRHIILWAVDIFFYKMWVEEKQHFFLSDMLMKGILASVAVYKYFLSLLITWNN